MPYRTAYCYFMGFYATVPQKMQQAEADRCREANLYNMPAHSGSILNTNDNLR